MLPEALHLFVTFVIGVLLALYLTPIVRRGALRFGVLDHPDGVLKRQREAVPYLGGVAVYLAFIVTLALVFEFDARVLGLLLGGTIMLMVGLFDDMKVLPPWLKLAGQVLSALVLVKSGIFIQLEIVPLWARYVATVFWLVTMTNAINLIDVCDGLSASTTTIAALILALVAWHNGDVLIAVTAVALAGSVAGVLRYNWPPARIYLGDAGSLFTGFMLAALAMLGAYTRQNLVGALAPLVILCVPLGELVLISLARIKRGQKPWHGSHDHFALRLRHRGWSPAKVLAASAAVSVLYGAGGVAMILSARATAAQIVLLAAALGILLLLWLWRRCPPP